MKQKCKQLEQGASRARLEAGLYIWDLSVCSSSYSGHPFELNSPCSRYEKHTTAPNPQNQTSPTTSHQRASLFRPPAGRHRRHAAIPPRGRVVGGAGARLEAPAADPAADPNPSSSSRSAPPHGPVLRLAPFEPAGCTRSSTTGAPRAPRSPAPSVPRRNPRLLVDPRTPPLRL